MNVTFKNINRYSFSFTIIDDNSSKDSGHFRSLNKIGIFTIVRRNNNLTNKL